MEKLNRKKFQEWGKKGVKKRLGGKSKKEKSAIMRKVSLARFKPYKSGIKYLDDSVDIMN